MNHPSGGHGFDNKGDEERSLLIVRSSIGFMKTHLGLHSQPREAPAA
jgi:hypothetical protein